jgi:hypothetical protein
MLTWKTCPHPNNLNGTGGSALPSSPRFGGSSKSIKQIAHVALLPSNLTNGNGDLPHLFSHFSTPPDCGDCESGDRGIDEDVEALVLDEFHRRNANRSCFDFGLGEAGCGVAEVDPDGSEASVRFMGPSRTAISTSSVPSTFVVEDVGCRGI